MAERSGGLFRKEALDAHLGTRGEGEVLRLAPRWAGWTFGLLLASFSFALAYSVVGTVDEYASGVGIVRVQGRRELTARLTGTVSAVEAQPGQRVRAGQVLARFHGDEAELERLSREYDLQLVKVLDHPTDQAARARLTEIRSAREQARAQVDERLIKAPVDGVVSDVRIQPGKLIEAGMTVLSLVPDDARFEIIAVLPGNYRPRLRPGMPLRLQMLGYAHSYSEVLIDTIGDQVVGPAEIRRFLPTELADTLAIQGPVVLVTATLDSPTFEAEGKTYEYFDGMQGVAEARIQSKSILVTLLPGLESIL
ncbi:MAG TPA: HlyD family efflux transporter periplasmic adaptor subunit [Kofleriaceae bacterium]|nr:HlyD family efflux transporter periplasmic adaptor subunit [Kofleriaceae bacterium]